MMPTLVVFAVMLPLFDIAENGIGPVAVTGMLVMLAGVIFELLADRHMHRHLSGNNSGTVCREGL